MIKQKKKYVINGGRSSIGGVKADVVAAELHRIHSSAGEVTAPAVVEAARPDKAPLHPAFEWDDQTAAEEYRLHQARTMIRVVHLVTTENDGSGTKIEVDHGPVMTFCPSQDRKTPGSYHPTVAVIERPDLYAVALQHLQARVSSALEAVSSLRDAAERSGGDNVERMARIAIAVQAMQTASAAVQALH